MEEFFRKYKEMKRIPIIEDKKPRPTPPKYINPKVEMVCPICRVYGTCVRFMVLKDLGVEILLTVATCMNCSAVFSMPYQEDKP